MKIITYPTTALEDWVTNFYLRLGIRSPGQINETVIARRLNIFIHRKPRSSFNEIYGRYMGISIDSRETLEIQREMFFHELCHILRHSGIQSMMPEAFRELQEWDARNFTLYAAIPYHMLHFIDLEQIDPVGDMAYMFKVSYDLAEERLEQIKRRVGNTYSFTPYVIQD